MPIEPDKNKKYEWRAVTQNMEINWLGCISPREVALWFLSLPLTQRRRTFLERRVLGGAFVAHGSWEYVSVNKIDDE
jgi:hypothetical protein